MKFSVIIPVYNKKETLARALDSVLTQTYRNFEVIVVNDGSTDGVEELLASYRAPRIISQENSGVSVARNTGIDAANGDFVCFLDADDRYERHHLATLNALIERYPEADMFFTSYCAQNADGTKIYSTDMLRDYAEDLYEQKELLPRPDFITDNVFDILNCCGDAIWNTNAMCLRRSVLADEELRFARGERLGEDVDMWLRFALRHKVAISLEVTNTYMREDSTATKNGHFNPDWVFARREEEIFSSPDIRDDVKHAVALLLDRYYLCCARGLAAMGEKKRARAFLSRVRNKWSKTHLLSAVFSLLPTPLCRAVLRRFS